jgi:hypothetical protein
LVFSEASAVLTRIGRRRRSMARGSGITAIIAIRNGPRLEVKRDWYFGLLVVRSEA